MANIEGYEDEFWYLINEWRTAETPEIMAKAQTKVDNFLFRLTHCQKTVEGHAYCGCKLDCHIHDWRAPYFTEKNHNEAVLKHAEDHYWDSLEHEKDTVILHLKSILDMV